MPLVLLFGEQIQPSLPDTINKLNRFPYHYGVKFVKALYASGCWDAIEKAYTSPPNTTEQIMHLEKYFDQEIAKTVEAPSITGNWSLPERNSFGECFVFVMLDKWISEADDEKAAEG